MLIKAKTLNGYNLNGLDGEIGKVKEFYFDDKHWAIRYLVVDTGSWLADRQVLISPYALGDVNQEYQNIAVHLTKSRLKTVRHWTVTSLSHGNSKMSTMVIMDGRRIREAHTCGGLLQTLFVRIKNGECFLKVKNRGIPTCAALRM